MQFNKDYLDEYAVFEENSVTVEIPFISNAFFEDLARPFITVLTKNALEGDFYFLTTKQLIVGFRYEFGPSESKELIKEMLLIMVASIFMTYYSQRDKSDIQDIQFAIAA